MPSMIRKLAAERSVVLAMLPLMLAVFVAFLVIGAAMPVLPLHVQATLGFGPAMVGSVAGCQFAAALVARIWSGRAADRRGAKWAVAGLGATVCAGLVYLLSLGFLTAPPISARPSCWARAACRFACCPSAANTRVAAGRFVAGQRLDLARFARRIRNRRTYAR